MIDTLKKLGEEDPEKYDQFWEGFRPLHQARRRHRDRRAGSALPAAALPHHPQPEQWSSLDEYVEAMKPSRSISTTSWATTSARSCTARTWTSMRRYGYRVLILTDPVDAFMLTRPDQIQRSHRSPTSPLADLELPEAR